MTARLGVALLCSATLLHAQAAPRVSADGEMLDGSWIAAPREAVFRGIPYAAAPVGALRWKPPERHVAQAGVRDASHFGPTCLQPATLTGAQRSPQAADESEDCLTLNVWTTNVARDSQPLPVMVWIHGGSNLAGASSRPQYDGVRLARHGVVLVSVNYRLGVMGFLAHPALSRESRAGASGNYALFDLVAALQWVQRNITAFGGDPARVTVFGQSAGALNVVHLLASPAANGLIHRAIAESGAPLDAMPTRSDAERVGQLFAATLGVSNASDVARALRALPASDVLQAQGAFLQTSMFGPIVDGAFLRELTANAVDHGRMQRVPTILGSTDLEMSTIPGAVPHVTRTVAAYRAWIGATFGRARDSLLVVYPAATDADVDLALRRLATDLYVGCPTRMEARAMTRLGAPSYLYSFTRVPPGDEAIGAAHGVDVEYVFGVPRKGARREPADSALTDAMITYWTHFAATGDPNGPTVPTWPAYRLSDDAYLELGTTIGAHSGPTVAPCDLMEPMLRALWRPRR